MGKYIDADKLKEIADRVYKQYEYDYGISAAGSNMRWIYDAIDSLQKNDTQVDKMLCSQIWWEEQGWIMISPDATIEGIDSLLKQVRKRLQQEQTEVNFKSEERKWVHNAVDNIFPEDGDFMSEVDFRKIIKDTARYFYELGLKVRKEE